MVEKTLTDEILETGEVAVTAREAERLGLPAHAADLSCTADGEEFLVQWRPSAGVLGGELLADHLQLHGEVGGLLRLQAAGGVLELRCLTPVRSRVARTTLIDWSATPTPTPAPAAPAKHPPRRDRRKERYRLRDRSEYDWRGPVGFHAPTLRAFEENIAKGGWDPAAVFDLRVRGEQLAAAGGFDELLAAGLAHVEHMPHQEATALKVLRQMRGRAILADEVGLGKTIEAGLIMKELIVRGLVRRVLVLSPASLRDQWRQELDEKFDTVFEIVTDASRVEGDLVIMSVTLARRNIASVTKKPWDLVIVDEAHKNINGPKTRELISTLDSRYLLFLTATPVQNKLLELYNLVELLRPGTFASPSDFKSRFVDRTDERRPVNAAALRKLVSDVMVRTTREQVGLDRVKRYAVDVPITLSETERKIYDLCTKGLRRVMGPQDGLRRRNLAHRLTASPRSLATTAHTIATAHPDPKVRAFLNELFELAIDFGRTTRQRTLVSTVERWVDDPDKGKVIVFTQHVDTLDDLVRVLAEEGIDTAVYHGGLSVSARQRAIEQFRREAPVMLATDAGAEGLNLQFANCVVNYDLPWNPMRVEQRIGRVHRLTQPKDAVYVANFFAASTIDEHVYRLLHDKLRMFELLFGQVTTILGEIETGEGAGTFEGEILDAFLAESDAEMRRRIADLGRRVDAAYHEAQKAVQDVGGLNSWLVDRSYREQLRKQAADELRPKVAAAEKKRQREVRRFVLDYFRTFGARVTKSHDDLITATLPPLLREHFGGREELHLAFSPAALELHRDAELCAAGSEVFEELLLSLREYGDLRASMPAPARVPQKPWLPHAPNLRLVERELVGPDEWAGRAVFRTTIDAVDAGEDVRIIDIGDPGAFASDLHRDLDDGDALPETVPVPSALLERVLAESEPALRADVDHARREVEERTSEERRRILENAAERKRELELSMGSSNADVRERARVDLDRITRLQRHYEQVGSAKVDLRADLLGLEIIGSPSFLVSERWTDDQERDFRLYTNWVPGTPTKGLEYLDPAGRPIMRLELCAEGHPVDADATRTCPGCGAVHCDLCDEPAYRECPACGVAQCAACRSTESRTCRACDEPERAEELDRDGQRGWRLGFGATLLVGSAVSTLRRPDAPEVLLRSGRDANPAARQRVMGHAHALGWRLDLGGRVVRLSPSSLPDTAVVLEDVEDWTWVVQPRGGSQVEPDVLALLGDLRAPKLVDASARRLDVLVDALRAADEPDPPPCLAALGSRRVRYLEATGGALWWIERRELAGREPQLERQELRFEASTDETGARVFTARAGVHRFDARRRHRSVHVEVVDERTGQVIRRLFIPEVPGISMRSELAAVTLAERHGLPMAAALHVDETGREPRFAEPAGATLVRRKVEPVWLPVPGVFGPVFGDGDAMLVPDAPHAPDTVTIEAESVADLLDAIPAEDEPEPFTLRLHHRVTERWRGASATTRTRLVPPGEDAFPVLDDTGLPAADFCVDSRGHLHEPDRGWRCLACGRSLCRACKDGALAPCASCGQEACGACRARRPVEVLEEHCELCGARSCGDCGRTLAAQPCVLCGRHACAGCWDRGRCAGCSALEPMDEEAVAALPRELAAVGLRVRGNTAAGTTVVVLAGATRREFAVVRDGTIIDWVSLRPVADERRLALAVAQRTERVGGDMAVVVDPAPSTSLPPTQGVVLHDRTERAWSWEVRSGGTVLAAAGELLPLGDGTVIEAAGRALGVADIRTPRPASPRENALLQPLVPVVDAVAATTLRLTRDADRVRVQLTGRGVQVHRTRNGDVRQQVYGWVEGLGPAQPVFDGWQIEPDKTVHAVAPEATVCLAAFGHVLCCAVSRDGEWELYRLDDEDVAVIALCDRLGLRRSPLSVSRTFRSDDVELLVVDGAERVSQSFEPRWVAAGAPAADGALREALRLWVDPSVTAPLSSAPKADWPAALVERLRAAIEPPAAHPSRGVVGLTVRERWRSGEIEREIAYDVVDSGPATLASDDTGAPAHRLRFDRAGHLAAAPITCPYCESVTCSACADGVVACELCGIDVCGRCAADDVSSSRLCPACGSLEPLGRLKAIFRRHVHGHAVVGEDRLHRVAFVAGNATPYVVVRRAGADEVRDLELTEAQAAILNRAAKAERFAAAGSLGDS